MPPRLFIDKSWVDFAFPDHIIKKEVFINNEEKRTAMMSKNSL
jgi:hypothetical protein